MWIGYKLEIECRFSYKTKWWAVNKDVSQLTQGSSFCLTKAIDANVLFSSSKQKGWFCMKKRLKSSVLHVDQDEYELYSEKWIKSELSKDGRLFSCMRLTWFLSIIDPMFEHEVLFESILGSFISESKVSKSFFKPRMWPTSWAKI